MGLGAKSPRWGENEEWEVGARRDQGIVEVGKDGGGG